MFSYICPDGQRASGGTSIMVKSSVPGIWGYIVFVSSLCVCVCVCVCMCGRVRVCVCYQFSCPLHNFKTA